MHKVALGCCTLALPHIASASSNQAPIDTGVTAWMLTSTMLVLMMIPGLAMFYGGLVRSKNVLGTMMHSYTSMSIIGIVWIAVGYSIAFGPNVWGGFIGWDPSLVFLNGIDEKIMDQGIPEYVFSMFQGKFAIIAPAIMAGAFAERVKFRSFCTLIVMWSLLVYLPLCHWVWYEHGFLYKLGAIDFAGGTVVHISSGISGLIAALYLGKRLHQKNGQLNPNNLTMTLTGAGFLWVGWFGFNAGNSINSNLQTAQALTATQVSAAASAFSWMIIERTHRGKVGVIGLAGGILAGLVAITPAAGVVKPSGSILIGTSAAIACYLALRVKVHFGYDDTLDAFGIHGVAGIVGATLLVFFMRDSTINEIIAQNPNWTLTYQLMVQLYSVIIALIYCGFVTFAILWIIDKTMGIRVESSYEQKGIDSTLHGEVAYDYNS